MSQPLDLSPFDLNLVYEADFSRPLLLAYERDLLRNDQRVKAPSGVEWIFEGNGEAWTEGGKLHVTSQHGEYDHIVLWHIQNFPSDILIDFEVDIPADGLAIVFFAATTRDGGDIFEPGLPVRGGVFSTYHTGELDCYHTSYWAGGRGTANLRKNHGFALVATGPDHIAEQGPGRHRVRILKVAGRIALETVGKVVFDWQDDGRVLGEGRIGLRQMRRSQYLQYHNLRVYQVNRR